MSKFGDPRLNGWWVIARTDLVTDGDWRTDGQTQATTIPKGQYWPRVKNAYSAPFSHWFSVGWMCLWREYQHKNVLLSQFLHKYAQMLPAHHVIYIYIYIYVYICGNIHSKSHWDITGECHECVTHDLHDYTFQHIYACIILFVRHLSFQVKSSGQTSSQTNAQSHRVKTLSLITLLLSWVIKTGQTNRGPLLLSQDHLEVNNWIRGIKFMTGVELYCLGRCTNWTENRRWEPGQWDMTHHHHHHHHQTCQRHPHYNDVIMTTMASQITSLTVVYSTVYSDADQRKHQSSASLVFVWGIHRERWIPRTKGQLRGKCFHLMPSSCFCDWLAWI